MLSSYFHLTRAGDSSQGGDNWWHFIGSRGQDSDLAELHCDELGVAAGGLGHFIAETNPGSGSKPLPDSQRWMHSAADI